jgi:hypothetical protein
MSCDRKIKNNLRMCCDCTRNQGASPLSDATARIE